LSSTYLETEGSSSGRRLYVHVWFNMVEMQGVKQNCFLRTFCSMQRYVMW